jgi:hypothetical protein
VVVSSNIKKPFQRGKNMHLPYGRLKGMERMIALSLHRMISPRNKSQVELPSHLTAADRARLVGRLLINEYQKGVLDDY